MEELRREYEELKRAVWLSHDKDEKKRLKEQMRKTLIVLNNGYGCRFWSMVPGSRIESFCYCRSKPGYDAECSEKCPYIKTK